MKMNVFYRFLYRHKLMEIPAVLHVKGKYPNLTYSYSYSFQTRVSATISFIKNAFNKYEDLLRDKELDFYFYTDDKVSDADYRRCLLKSNKMFAYSGILSEYPNIIPVPDFIYDSWPEVGIDSWEDTIEKCLKAGEAPWRDSRCFWIGNVTTHPTRQILVELGEKFPKYICAPTMRWKDSRTGKKLNSDKFVSLEDHTQYKYLIDVQGNGYSGRLKILLHMHRVVFIADRKPKDWFFPYLKDMENCVFVREDMSDLVDKIKLLENNDTLYHKIVAGCDSLVSTYLSKNYAEKYLVDSILSYGLDGNTGDTSRGRK